MSIDGLRSWLWEGVAGVRSGRAVKRRSGSSRRTSQRSLRVEPLESRELLSVVASGLEYKDFAFTSTGIVTGTMSAAVMSNNTLRTIPVSIYHGTDENGTEYPGAAFSGTFEYTSATQGTIGPAGSSLSGHDAWIYKIPASYHPEPQTWTLAGGTILSVADVAGRLSTPTPPPNGGADLTTALLDPNDPNSFNPNKEFVATTKKETDPPTEPPTYTYTDHDIGGIYTVSGTFSPLTRALSMTITIPKPATPVEGNMWGPFTYTGTLTPTNQDAFDINIVQPQPGIQQSDTVPQLQWETINGVPNSVQFDVDISGPVQKVSSEATPVANIQVFWAKGPNLTDRLSTKGLVLDTATTYKSGIPIYWNSASGHYTLSNIVPARVLAGATNLLFVAVPTARGAQPKVLATLDLPKVSIVPQSAIVNEPLLGATANAFFDVTYSVPDGYTPSNTGVTVAWKALKGTATANRDFIALPGILTFNAPGKQTISVQILADSLAEPDETFSISATVTGACFGGPATETIHDTAPPIRSTKVGRSAALGAYFSQLGQGDNKDAAGDLNPAVA